MLTLEPIMASLFSLLIVVILLLNVVMLASRWLKNYVLAFALESWLIALLTAGCGYYTGHSDLYVVAGLTLLFRGLILPGLLKLMVNKLKIKHEIHSVIQPSTSLVLCVLLFILAFAVSIQLAGQLKIDSHVTVLALMVMISTMLMGFFLLAIRDQALSKILALLVLENGVFLGSLFLVPLMPMFIELVILFDLLIAVACFGILMNYLTAQVGSTSTHELNRLVG